MPRGAAVLIARATGQCLLFIFEKEEGQGQKPEGCLGAGWASPSNLNSVSLWKSQLQLTPVGLILRNQTDLKISSLLPWASGAGSTEGTRVTAVLLVAQPQLVAHLTF